MRVALHILPAAGQEFEYHQQLINQIVDQIAIGALRSGDRLDTIGEVQEQLRLAHATVARAYVTLESRGIIHTARRAGSVIAEISPELLLKLRREYGERQAAPLVQTLGTVHLDAKEIVKIVKAAIANRERVAAAAARETRVRPKSGAKKSPVKKTAASAEKKSPRQKSPATETATKKSAAAAAR